MAKTRTVAEEWKRLQDRAYQDRVKAKALREQGSSQLLEEADEFIAAITDAYAAAAAVVKAAGADSHPAAPVQPAVDPHTQQELPLNALPEDDSVTVSVPAPA